MKRWRKKAASALYIFMRRNTTPKGWYYVAALLYQNEDCSYCKSRRMMPIIAGKPWMWKIFLSTVIAPYRPATKIHPRKNREMFLCHCMSQIKNVQSSPAARKPLYRPWLAAITFVLGKRSLSTDWKTLGPRVVHANISNQRKYRWSSAIKPMMTLMSIIMLHVLQWKYYFGGRLIT